MLYNVQIIVGNHKITLTGAAGYETTTSSGRPEMNKRAPVGGATRYTLTVGDTEVLVHEVPDPDPEYVEPPKTGLAPGKAGD